MVLKLLRMKLPGLKFFHNLTATNKHLLWLAKGKTKEKNYTSAWMDFAGNGACQEAAEKKHFPSKLLLRRTLTTLRRPEMVVNIAC